jgi:threonine synthase
MEPAAAGHDKMKYISTRGGAPTLGFVDVLLAGLAADGGLYVPETWPTFSAAELRTLRGKPYADVAFTVLKPFVGGEIADADLKAMIDDAYGMFAHKAVVPLKQLAVSYTHLTLPTTPYV